MVRSMSHDYEGKAVIGKLDVDNNQLAAEKFGIRSIPTILIFKGGQLVDTIIGAVGKPYITERLEAHVN